MVTKKISFQDRKKQNTPKFASIKISKQILWSFAGGIFENRLYRKKICSDVRDKPSTLVKSWCWQKNCLNDGFLKQQWEWRSLAKNLGVTPERVGRTNAKCFKIERERRDAASFARKKTLLLATNWVGVSVSSRAIKQPISHAVNACLDRTAVYSSLFEVVSLWLYRNHISVR